MPEGTGVHVEIGLGVGQVALGTDWGYLWRRHVVEEGEDKGSD